MRPLVAHGPKAAEIAVSPIYPETVITVVQKSNCVAVYENCELIDILEMPIMRIVRAIRLYCDNATINVI